MRVRMIVALLGLVALSSGEGRAYEDHHGAIAAARDGSYGYSYDHPTRRNAERAALRECGSLGCVVKLWFKNNCAAYARGRGGEGWAYNDSLEDAKQRAIDECEARGSGCEVVCWACNTR